MKCYEHVVAVQMPFAEHVCGLGGLAFDCPACESIRDGSPLRSDLRGKLVAIDALIANALVVADGELALRLVGAQELAREALTLLESAASNPALIQSSEAHPSSGFASESTTGSSLTGSAPPDLLTPETAKALRVHLWLSHGHRGVYGDDGEMQCSMCSPVWDYKRAPLEDVVLTAIASRRAVNAEALRTLVASSPSASKET